MKSRCIPASALALLMVTAMTSCNQPTKPENSTNIATEANNKNFDTARGEQAAEFIVNAVSRNYAEIKIAKLALSQSTNEDVKKIAQLLKKDHEQSLTELKGYATKKGITIPLEETIRAEKDIENLSEKRVENFDKKWCSVMVTKHEKSIEELEDRFNRTEDPELKAWIMTTLPQLKGQLAMLEQHEQVMRETSKSK